MSGPEDVVLSADGRIIAGIAGSAIADAEV
ncbi:hypothetical protein [Nocardia asiatica]